MEFQSAFGGFEEEGRCYVITTPDTPRPWEHYLYSGDGKFQAIITQRGEGLSFR
jgi:cellobiose phosphorylase